MTEQSKFEDRRRLFRAPTSVAAVTKSTDGAVQGVEVSDLSAEGCGVTSSGHPLVPGRVYGLKLDGLESLVTTAKWTAGKDAGLQFDRPLHAAVADHLAARFRCGPGGR